MTMISIILWLNLKCQNYNAKSCHMAMLLKILILKNIPFNINTNYLLYTDHLCTDKNENL